MILAINGTLFAFLFIYVLPIALHIKCVFYSSVDTSPRETELGNVNNAQIASTLPDKYSHFTNEKKEDLPPVPIEHPLSTETQIRCNVYPTRNEKILHLTLMALMTLFGLFVLGYSLYSLFRGED